MTKKQEATSKYLNRSFYIDQQINSKINHLNSLDSLVKKITSTLGGTSSSGTKKVDIMQTTIANIMDLKAEINEKIDEFVDLQREIMHVIEKLSNEKYQTLLTYRYLSFQEWELIALEMGYNIRHIYKLHNEALQMVFKFIPRDKI